MHSVVFLLRNSGEIGKPKSPEHKQKESYKPQITFLIEGLFKFHRPKIDREFNLLLQLTHFRQYPDIPKGGPRQFKRSSICKTAVYHGRI